MDPVSYTHLKEFTVPVNGLKSQPGTEYFVNVSLTTVEPEPLIPAGYEIAYDQFQLPIQAEKRIYKANGPALTTATVSYTHLKLIRLLPQSRIIHWFVFQPFIDYNNHVYENSYSKAF